ncbi:Dihydroorotate dehydrogenase (quinone) [uncultured archaeon]|nr:Dihydroorotate dehydrogenase (quinone) [uncultured archaeon]
MYKLLRKALFKMNPETVHNRFTTVGHLLGKTSFTRSLTGLLWDYENSLLHQEILGIKFRNPVGLSAGFDYNAKLVQILPSVGFGFVEVGSVTARPCKGNEGPTLHRLPKDKSIIVYKGLKNDGIDVIVRRLESYKKKIPVGLSIARTNSIEVTDDMALKDWAYSYYEAMNSSANYVTINISCPNAFSGLKFTDPTQFEMLMKELRKIDKKKPVFIKISPDLNDNHLKELVELSLNFQVDGFITTNLSKDRTGLTTDKNELDNFKGGHSGKPISLKSLDTLKKVKKLVPEDLPLISVGGIFSPYDAFERLENGASLVQLITGMIYEGPGLISNINQGLVALLKEKGYKNLSELTHNPLY